MVHKGSKFVWPTTLQDLASLKSKNLNSFLVTLSFLATQPFYHVTTKSENKIDIYIYTKPLLFNHNVIFFFLGSKTQQNFFYFNVIWILLLVNICFQGERFHCRSRSTIVIKLIYNIKFFIKYPCLFVIGKICFSLIKMVEKN